MAAAAAIVAARRNQQAAAAKAQRNNDAAGLAAGIARRHSLEPGHAAQEAMPEKPLHGYRRFARECKRLHEGHRFQVFITIVILLASLLVGMQQYDMEGWPDFVAVLEAVDWVILSIFIVEIIVKTLAKLPRPWLYFTDRDMWHWNTFDFFIVAACLVPQLGSQAALLRLLRLLRVLKLLKMIVQLQVILRGLARGISSIVYIGLLLFLILYLYAIVGMMLFRKNDPMHFGGLGFALVTLFRAATFDDWTDLMYINWFGCAEYGYPALSVSVRNGSETAACPMEPVDWAAKWSEERFGPGGDNNRTIVLDGDMGAGVGWVSPLYWISFILIASIVMLSLFVGAITLGMSQSMEEVLAEKKALHDAKMFAKADQLIEELQGESKAARVLQLWMGRTDETETSKSTRRGKSFKEHGAKALPHEAVAWCRRVTTHPYFTSAITAVILLASVMVGVDTDESSVRRLNCNGGCGSAVSLAIEWTINAIFTAEVVLKVVAEVPRPWHYFHSGWNCFDFVIVAFVYLPIGGSFVMVLRLLRLLRVLKLVRALPALQVIVSALIEGLGSIGYIALLLTLILYLFAIVGMLLFADNDPWHFGSLHLAMFSLFRASTLEDWTDIMYVNMYGCDVYGYEGNYMLNRWCRAPSSSTGFMYVVVLYFLVFVTLSALCMMALFIGVVTTSMQEATDKQAADKREKADIAGLVAEHGVEQARLDQFRELFDMFDVSGDGKIDQEEFSFAINCINKGATPNQIGDWMLLGDPEGVGEIDFMNFCRVLLVLKTQLDAAKQEPPPSSASARHVRPRARGGRSGNRAPKAQRLWVEAGVGGLRGGWEGVEGGREWKVGGSGAGMVWGGGFGHCFLGSPKQQ